jgi:mannosyl-glycoprotein endo-beta-N-acetylglucosaminidase
MRLRCFVVGVLLSTMLLSTSVGVGGPASVSAQSCDPCPATVTTNLRLRSSASLTASVLAVMPAGSQVSWYPTYGISNGFARVLYGSTIGWAFADYMLLFPAPGQTTAYLNLRSGAGTGYSVVTVMPPNAAITVLSGPTNGFYRVAYGTYSGFAFGSYITFIDTNTSFPIGSVATTTTGLNMRSGAGLGYSVVAVLPAGKAVTILDGPIFANNYGWYRVSASGYGTGWVAGDFLR